MGHLSLINGPNTGKLAPKPKYGLVRAIYSVLEALGPAHYRQIVEFLPAAIMKANQVATDKKIQKCLSNGVYRGYFEHSEYDSDHPATLRKIKKGTFQIAKEDFYNSRQKAIEDLDHRPYANRKRKPNEIVKTEIKIVNNWPLIISIGIACFMAGLSIGIFVGQFS